MWQLGGSYQPCCPSRMSIISVAQQAVTKQESKAPQKSTPNSVMTHAAFEGRPAYPARARLSASVQSGKERHKRRPGPRTAGAAGAMFRAAAAWQRLQQGTSACLRLFLEAKTKPTGAGPVGLSNVQVAVWGSWWHFVPARGSSPSAVLHSDAPCKLTTRSGKRPC